MKKIGNNYRHVVEGLVCLFTAEDGVVKILLTRKKNEPYKGYWILPNETVPSEETVEECVSRMMKEQYEYSNFYQKQNGTFSALDRDPDNRIIGVSFLGIIDSVRALILHKETEDIDEFAWFPIRELPKIGYDHEEIIHHAIRHLKEELSTTDAFKVLFPGDFTLPEIQKVFEQVIGNSLDKRNFRKKILSLNIIEETGEKEVGRNGRPAVLYRLKEMEENIRIF